MRQFEQEEDIDNNYQPVGIPLPPLQTVYFPRIFPDHTYNLSDQGWTRVTYETCHDPDVISDLLFTRSQDLFRACSVFFDQPISYKEKFIASNRASELGFVSIPGEKEYLTLRDIQSTPQELRDQAIAFWEEAGCYLNEVLGRIAQSLGLPRNALTKFSLPCIEMGDQETATMLRLFRYEGDNIRKKGIVAEAHKDLGLLSLVIGDKPGLEVWNRYSNSWNPIERAFFTPAATLLVGRQLAWLSNGRYAAGQHRVRSYTRPFGDVQSPSTTQMKHYRYSIVFVLRAHSPVPINTDNLTTCITGPFSAPVKDKTARDLFLEFQRSVYNVNAPFEVREEQKKSQVAAQTTDKSGSVEEETYGTG
ncbi:hypothetical protein F5884DRAFT_788120 [Xylogone sp. PMI_703]|nr:hypothetical protein F5884DRAFT_788120 [Xylogone sp. PMI_703]